jgi:O-antigen/teichoic acid export membrane protein
MDATSREVTTRTKRFLGGFTTGYVHMAVATAVGLWLTPFLLGRLGGSTYGLWLVGTQVIAYLLLMDMGIVALLPRETAYVTGRTGRSDAPELRTLVEQTMTLGFAQVPIVLLAAVLTLWFLPAAWQPLRVPLAVVLGLFVVTFPLRTFQAALVGLQDLAFVGRVQFAAWASGTIVTIGLVANGFGLPAMAAGWCTTQLVAVIACAARLRSRFGAAMPSGLSLGTRESARGYVGRSFWVALSQTAQVLLNGTDVLIIGALLGPAAVVPYACTGKLIAVLANQPQAILQSAAPALSELRQAGDRPRLFQVSAALAQTTLAVSGLVACLVLAVNAGFVTWWVGADQFAGLGITILLVAAMLVRHFNTTNVYALFCFGHERRLALTALADGIVSLASGVAFIAAFGMAGAPLAAIAGVLLVSVPLNLQALSLETAVPRSALFTSLLPWLIRFAIVASVVAVAGALIRPATFSALALTASATAALYALAVVTPLLRSPAGVYLQPLLATVGRYLAPARLRPRWLS